MKLGCDNAYHFLHDLKIVAERIWIGNTGTAFGKEPALVLMPGISRQKENGDNTGSPENIPRHAFGR